MAILLAGAIGVAATWGGILVAYDSYEWTGGHGWPVSFCIVALIFVGLRRRRADRARRNSTGDAGCAACRFERELSRDRCSTDFMINTWIAATLVAAVAGVVGFFVVIRGASFAAHALPLSAFPGAAAANLLGVNPLFGLLVFSGARRGRHQPARAARRRDLATALSLVMLLGLGALFLSRTTEYFQAIYALLFGEVLGVSNADLGPMLALSAVSIALVVALFRPLLLNSVSPELGETMGVSARLIDVLFLGVVALATAMALPVVGALLVFSLMVVGPPPPRAR